MKEKYRSVSFLAVSIFVLAFIFFIVNVSNKQTKSSCPIHEANYTWAYTKSPAGRCFEVWQREQTLTNSAEMGMSEISCDKIPEGYIITPANDSEKTLTN